MILDKCEEMLLGQIAGDLVELQILQEIQKDLEGPERQRTIKLLESGQIIGCGKGGGCRAERRLRTLLPRSEKPAPKKLRRRRRLKQTSWKEISGGLSVSEFLDASKAKE